MNVKNNNEDKKVKSTSASWFKSKVNKFTGQVQTLKTKDGWKVVGKKTGKSLNENKLLIIVAIFCIVIGSMNSSFWSKNNWENIFKQNAYLGVLTIGMTFVILTGGIDLSVGSIIALTGSTLIKLINNGTSAGGAIIIALIIGIIIGLCQGLLISFLKLQPFIVTLAGMLLFRGLSYVVTENMGISAPTNETLQYWSAQKWIGINMQIWVLLILMAITFFVLKFTIFGRNVYATGSNEQAARYSGIRTKLIICSVYIISGFMAALAGVMAVSLTKSANPGSTGNGAELEAVAAVVLGGTTLVGGRGGVIKSFVGFAVLAVIKNALFAIGYDMNIQKIFSGSIVLLAVVFEKDYDLIYRIKKLFRKDTNNETKKEVKTETNSKE